MTVLPFIFCWNYSVSCHLGTIIVNHIYIFFLGNGEFELLFLQNVARVCVLVWGPCFTPDDYEKSCQGDEEFYNRFENEGRGWRSLCVTWNLFSVDGESRPSLLPADHVRRWILSPSQRRPQRSQAWKLTPWPEAQRQDCWFRWATVSQISNKNLKINFSFQIPICCFFSCCNIKVILFIYGCY